MLQSRAFHGGRNFVDATLHTLQCPHALETVFQIPGHFLAEGLLGFLDGVAPVQHFHELLGAEGDGDAGHDDGDLCADLAKAVKRLWPMDVHVPLRLRSLARPVRI